MVAAIDAMITGEALMLSALTVGSTVAGRPAFCRFCSMVGADLLDVGAERELGDDEGQRVGRRGLQALEAGHAGDGALDRLGHLLRDVRGAGAGQRRDDRDDRELDVGQQLLLEAAPGEDAGDEQGPGQQERDAPLGDGELGEAAHAGSFRVGGGDAAGARSGGGRARRRRAAARPSAPSARRTRSSSSSSRTRDQLAHLAGVELAEAVDELGAGGRQADDHLAAVGGVVAAGGEAVVHDPVDEAADGGQRHAEAGDELRHVELAGSAEQVQDLRLGHRDVDLQELRRVAVREALHERLVAGDDLVDDGGAVVQG